MRKAFALAAAFFLLGALPLRADVLSLRCTIAPAKGRAYSGYIWSDLSNKKAYEQWYTAGKSAPPIDGPFAIVMTPNELTIAESQSAKGKAQILVDRTNGGGSAFGGKILCTSSDVALPVRPQKH